MSNNQEEQEASTQPPRLSQQPQPRLILILGGARSGKSTFAERLATESGRQVAFIATATPSDEEMVERITRHQASRPTSWRTIEEPLDLSGAVRQAAEVADVLLLDCMTLWLANKIAQESGSDHEHMAVVHSQFNTTILQEIEKLIQTIESLPPHKTLITVSNEVGFGIVPVYPIGRIYRDTLGFVNQRLAQSADRVYLMLAGLAVDIKRLHQEASL